MKYESACERDFFSVSSLLAALDKVIYLHICVCPACTHTHTERGIFLKRDPLHVRLSLENPRCYFYLSRVLPALMTLKNIFLTAADACF